jgi:hypothetical protein
MHFLLSLYETLHSLVPFNENRLVKRDEADDLLAQYPDEIRILECADGFLDIIAILFSQTISELSKNKNDSIRAVVLESFEKHPLSDMLGICRESYGFAAVFHMAKYALSSNLTTLSERCWEELQKVTRKSF